MKLEIVSQAETGFTARVTAAVGADAGWYAGSLGRLDAHYGFDFTVGTPGTYRVGLQSHFLGAFTFVNDGASAHQTKGHLRGTLEDSLDEIGVIRIVPDEDDSNLVSFRGNGMQSFFRTEIDFGPLNKEFYREVLTSRWFRGRSEKDHSLARSVR